MFKIIFLIPIGELSIREDDLIEIKDGISEVLKTEVKVDAEILIPKGADNPLRNQWLASRIIESLPAGAGLLLGIIDKDLYAPGLNFVFGEAHPTIGKGVISITRLRPEFWGEDEDHGLFKQRIIKEAVHEIGHLLGLPHCSDKRCIMYFSNTIADTDKKGPDFCRKCLFNLEKTDDRRPEGEGSDCAQDE